MLVYKDIFSDDEMLSDSYVCLQDKPVRGMMTVACKLKTEDGVGQYDIGANASQEEQEDELAEADCKQGVNVVMDFNMSETQFGKKKEFKVYFKEIITTIMKKKKEDDEKITKEQIDEFKEDCTELVKWVMDNFDDLQFFIGVSNDGDSMTSFLINKGAGDITMYYFTHAMKSEKF